MANTENPKSQTEHNIKMEEEENSEESYEGNNLHEVRADDTHNAATIEGGKTPEAVGADDTVDTVDALAVIDEDERGETPKLQDERRGGHGRGWDAGGVDNIVCVVDSGPVEHRTERRDSGPVEHRAERRGHGTKKHETEKRRNQPNPRSKSGKNVTFKKDDSCAAFTKKCTATCCLAWCKKYLWEGRDGELPASAGDPTDLSSPSCLYKYWTLWAFVMPALVVHCFWWAYAAKVDLWDQFKVNYGVTIAVAFGALIAGMESWGVGSVMFPLMVLGFGVAPSVARDVCLMLQAVGRPTLSASILLLGHTVERHAAVACSLGGAAGVILGLEVVEPVLGPAHRTVVYSSCWALAGAVLLVYAYHGRRGAPARERITEICCCRALGLMIVSFAGGVLTAITGTGLDLLTFAALTVYFRVKTTVAGATTVLVTASGSMMGYYWRRVILATLLTDAWHYYHVAVPVLVCVAPLGYILTWHCHNLVLAALAALLSLVALVATYVTVTMTTRLIAVTACVLLGGAGVLLFAGFWGVRILRNKGLVTIVTSTPKTNNKAKRKEAGGKTERQDGERKDGERKEGERKGRRHVFLDFVGADSHAELHSPGAYFGRGWEGTKVGREPEGASVGHEWEGANVGREWGGANVDGEWEGANVSREWEGTSVITFRELEANESDL